MLQANRLTMEGLSGSLRDYREPRGRDLLERVAGFYEWQNVRREQGLWPYCKSTNTAPKTTCDARTDAGQPISGVNFGSQDYLSLASHPAIVETAKEAIESYGVHSAGSAALLGNTRMSLQLEEAISRFLNGMAVTLYPTGWAAGFGAVQGLVRPNDHVVMDVLAHSCLQEGARAATQNIHFHGHLNIASVARKLRKIRENDATNGILVVTESLFSMHSDTPDLVELKQVCQEFGAILLVDMAHDLGCIGEQGLGHVGLQNMLEEVDVVVASFSKTFASNGGFVATKSTAVKEYLKYYSATQTFSNALSPVQAAVVLKAFEIVQSEEGRELRNALMSNILYLRSELAAAGMEVLGDPSAIVPVYIGAEDLGRVATQRLGELGAIVNLVEYPAVPRGGARYRIQVMAKHRREDCDLLVASMQQAMESAQAIIRDHRERCEIEDQRIVAAA